MLWFHTASDNHIPAHIKIIVVQILFNDSYKQLTRKYAANLRHCFAADHVTGSEVQGAWDSSREFIFVIALCPLRENLSPAMTASAMEDGIIISTTGTCQHNLYSGIKRNFFTVIKNSLRIQ